MPRPQNIPAGKRQMMMTINASIIDRITVEAERRVVGRNLVVEAALREWLERHEGHDASTGNGNAPTGVSTSASP